MRPAPDNHGIVFVRTDLERITIPALISHVSRKARRTTLRNGAASVDTTEHCMSAIAGLSIDNLIIEIDSPELPGLDGSARPYIDALVEAGVVETTEPRKRLIITEPVVVRRDDMMLAALPTDETGMQAVYDLDYGDHPVIGRQVAVFNFNSGNYADEVAPARTFVLESEVEALKAAGFGKHLTAQDLLVIGDSGPLGGNSFRFSDEPARHKLLDMIGDLYLLGAPIQGRIIAYKSGHALNHALVRALIKQFGQQQRQRLATTRSVLDIRKLLRILPHRYPMLLVDRVIEIDGDRRALGVKNVTVNEPFFQGHYPGAPIMPGVLIVEAMAQLSGVLIGQKLENTGKLAVLMSMDRVKIRRPVTPGDQMILEAEAVRIRSALAHMRCRAYVGQELAAEAEIKFVLLDDEQEDR